MRLASRPTAVLFACNRNRVRSPMAEALLKRLVGRDVFVDSCGLEARPEFDGEADPLAVEAMREIGCDLSNHHGKTFEALAVDSFDLIVALTPEVRAHAEAAIRTRAAAVECWKISDPTLIDGSRESRLTAYRATRDELAARIAARFS
jgi:protein-tyrosine-phosphatase